MQRINSTRSLSFPTLFRYSSSDRTLKTTASLGILFSLLAFFGFIPSILLIFLWIFFLSFYLVGYPFLSFQWDALLVETGFIGIFYALLSPSPIVLQIALWVLCFRLLFSSALVKWTSGCKEWRSLRALEYHFETQPLPNLGGFFAHQLNKKILKIMTGLVFVFEGVVPFLFFGTSEMRIVGACLSIFFQFLIASTGNFAYFNLLTITLLITLIDNQYWTWLIPEVIALDQNLWLVIFLNCMGAFFILSNILMLLYQFFGVRVGFLTPFQMLGIFNTYGLFAVMTTIREEIILEGSNDQQNWKEYQFKYKPGPLNLKPKQIAPLHPRLDWQMWFVPLCSRNEEWFTLLVYKILHGSSEVLDLFKENPFPKDPPQYLRALRYRYHFCTIKEWRKSGNYWKRTFIEVMQNDKLRNL